MPFHEIANSNAARTCLTVLKHLLLSKWLVGSTISANLVAGLMEAGTFGLILIAVGILVGESGVNEMPGAFVAILEMIPFPNKMDSETIFVLLIFGAIGLQIIKSGAEYLGSIGAIHLTKRASRQLQSEVLEKVLAQEYPIIARYPTGALGALISQADVVAQKLIVRVFNAGTLAIMLLSVYVYFLFKISVSLTLTALGIVGVLLLLMGGVVRRLKELGQLNTRSTLEHGKLVIDYLNSARLIKTSRAEQWAAVEIGRARDFLLDSAQKASSIEAAIGPGTQVLTIIAIGSFLVFGFLISEESMRAFAPSAVIFMVILQRLMHPVRTLNDCRMALANNSESLTKVGEVLAKEHTASVETVLTPFKSLRDRIKLQRVSFRYLDEKQCAVENVSFEIRKGDTVGIVGSSGAGKSTVVDLLLGLYQPTEGQIIVDGQRLQDLDPQQWLSKIGLVDQDILLLNTTVSENITLGRDDVTREMIEKACQRARADSFIERMGNGYNTEIGESGYRLSGGEKQRLAFARALLDDPELLILDEPTSALDSETEYELKRQLASFSGECTIVIVAHRLSTIAAADLIVVLDKGRLVEAGSRSELINGRGRFAKLWAMQMEEHLGA
jgi:ATP-binding cassette subfamily B protein/subfamily B ATP-binding cassette protein MsbA